MIQKYVVIRDDKNDSLVIEEYAVLERIMRNTEHYDIRSEKFSFVNREKYNTQKIKAAIIKNKHAIISSIRTDSLYPIGHYANALADSIAKLYESENSRTVELIFDDQDLLV
jgi:hypothetical protein